MTDRTEFGSAINGTVVNNYLKRLVNLLFKIIPLRESGDETLVVYMQSLQRELIGCKDLIEYLRYDARYLSLLAKLQWMIDNPDYRFVDFRREVFASISICNKLRALYAGGPEVE